LAGVWPTALTCGGRAVGLTIRKEEVAAMFGFTRKTQPLLAIVSLDEDGRVAVLVNDGTSLCEVSTVHPIDLIEMGVNEPSLVAMAMEKATGRPVDMIEIFDGPFGMPFYMAH
jgi:hypothetical protein